MSEPKRMAAWYFACRECGSLTATPLADRWDIVRPDLGLGVCHKCKQGSGARDVRQNPKPLPLVLAHVAEQRKQRAYVILDDPAWIVNAAPNATHEGGGLLGVVEGHAASGSSSKMSSARSASMSHATSLCT